MPKINYKPANLRGLGTDFQLKPGSNDVPDAVWSRWANDGEIKALVERGEIEFEPAPARKAAPKAEVKNFPKPPLAPDESPELTDEELEQLTANASKAE